MLTIIIDSLLIVGTALAIWRILKIGDKYKYQNIRKMHLMTVGLSYGATVILGLAMYFSYGTRICYALYGLRCVATVMFYSHLVMDCEAILAIPKEILNKFIVFICYSGIVLYVVDTFICKGNLEKAAYGFYPSISNPFHFILYIAIYAIYIIVFITFVVWSWMNAHKRRERFEVHLLGLVFGFCAIGFLSELFMYILKMEYFNIDTISNFFALIFLYILSHYHRTIQIKEEDFADDIAPNRTEIVFVINDELQVVFQDNRAKLLGDILGDKYLGRSITDIFTFSDDNLKEIKENTEEKPFGSSAEYSFAGRNVNMVFEHRLDRFGEMIASTVYVYNMEPKDSMFSVDFPGDKVSIDKSTIYDDAVKITKDIRALIVGEDLNFLNILKSELDMFQIKTTKAIGGSDAIERILNGEFDIIIIADGMTTMSSHELCMRIRAFDGDYFQNIPIILATENNMNDVYMEVLDSGFSDYLYKPIDTEKLGEVITRWSWKKTSKL